MRRWSRPGKGGLGRLGAALAGALLLGACARTPVAEPLVWREIREESREAARSLGAELAGVKARLGALESALSGWKQEAEQAAGEQARARELLQEELQLLGQARAAEEKDRAERESREAAEIGQGIRRLEQGLEELGLRLDLARGEAQRAAEAAVKAEARAVALGEALAREELERARALGAGEEALERMGQLGARLERLEQEVRGLPGLLAAKAAAQAELQAGKEWEPSAGPGWGVWLLGGLLLIAVAAAAVLVARSRPRARPAPAQTPAEPNRPAAAQPLRPAATPFERTREQPGEAPPRRVLAELRLRTGMPLETLARAGRQLLERSSLVLVEPGIEVAPDPEGGRVRFFFWTPGFVGQEQLEALQGRVALLGAEAGPQGPQGAAEPCP